MKTDKPFLFSTHFSRISQLFLFHTGQNRKQKETHNNQPAVAVTRFLVTEKKQKETIVTTQETISVDYQRQEMLQAEKLCIYYQKLSTNMNIYM